MPFIPDSEPWIISPYDLLYGAGTDEIIAMQEELLGKAPDDLTAAERNLLLLLEFQLFRIEYNRTNPYTPPEPSYLEWYPFNEEAGIDLNGDGVLDKVTVYMDRVDEWETKLALRINDAEIEISYGNGFPYFNDLVEGFAIVDIDAGDDYLEIVISNYDGIFDNSSIFFRYDGESIIYMNEGNIRGIYTDIEFPGNGEIITAEVASILQTWQYRQRYVVTGGSTLRAVQEIYEVYTPVFALVNFPLYAEMDETSPVILMEQASTVSFTAHDNIEWVQVTLADGQTGWFKVRGVNVIIAGDGDKEISATDVFYEIFFIA